MRTWKAGRPENTPEVLWSKVDKRGEDDCWNWKGNKGSTGYGKVQIKGKEYCAHRVIYNLANPGKITLNAPKDKKASGFLLHMCDNRLCCNPKHLWIGTNKENAEDRDKKGRRKPKLGADSPKSIFTHEQIELMIMLKLEQNKTSKQIAAIFNANPGTVKGVLRRELRRRNE